MKIRVQTGLAVLAILVSSGTAHALHYNRGHFVPAYEPCLAGNANTATSDGVPACSPPVPVSNCTTNPATALQLGESARTSYLMQGTGRRGTTTNLGIQAIATRIHLNGITDCQGVKLRDEIVQARFTLRVHATDPACATGWCTLPDFTYLQPLPCRSAGRCRLNGFTDVLFPLQGVAPLPLDIPFIVEVLRFDLLDRAGLPFATVGIGKQPAQPVIASVNRVQLWAEQIRDILFPADSWGYGATGAGTAWHNLSKITRAFEPCLPGATNTTTSDGQAACIAVPKSDCTTDPANALVPVVPLRGNYGSDSDGRGKFDVVLSSSYPEFFVDGWIQGVEDCSGERHEGALSMKSTFRTTRRDPACLGGSCTTVDTESLNLPLILDKGGVEHAGGTFPISDFSGLAGAETYSSELLGMEFLDASGHAVMSGPSLLFRCNADHPVDGGDFGFCFGN